MIAILAGLGILDDDDFEDRSRDPIEEQTAHSIQRHLDVSCRIRDRNRRRFWTNPAAIASSKHEPNTSAHPQPQPPLFERPARRTTNELSIPTEPTTHERLIHDAFALWREQDRPAEAGPPVRSTLAAQPRVGASPDGRRRLLANRSSPPRPLRAALVAWVENLHVSNVAETEPAERRRSSTSSREGMSPRPAYLKLLWRAIADNSQVLPDGVRAHRVRELRPRYVCAFPLCALRARDPRAARHGSSSGS